MSVWCCNALSYWHSHSLCDCHMIAPWHWGSVSENICDIAQMISFVILQIADILFVWCCCGKNCSISFSYCIWKTPVIFSFSCFHSSNFVVDGDTQSCNSSDYWADCGQQNRGNQLPQDKEYYLFGFRWDDTVKGTVRQVNKTPFSHGGQVRNHFSQFFLPACPSGGHPWLAAGSQ